MKKEKVSNSGPPLLTHKATGPQTYKAINKQLKPQRQSHRQTIKPTEWQSHRQTIKATEWQLKTQNDN